VYISCREYLKITEMHSGAGFRLNPIKGGRLNITESCIHVRVTVL